MKTVTKTALANVKQNKGRNFLCGCAIALTTFLIFVVLTVGYGMIRVQLKRRISHDRRVCHVFI